MAKKKIEVPLIGKLAVRHEFITTDQLKRALIICEESLRDGKKTGLPEVLVRTKMLRPDEMKRLHTITADYEERYSDESAEKHAEPFLIISDDGLMAKFVIPEKFNGDITIESVYSILKKKGVKHGIVKEYEITKYISNRNGYGEPLIVARGTPAYKGVDPVIECLFNERACRDDSLETGKKNSPFFSLNDTKVEEGDLLIEKHPLVPSDSGITVTADSIGVEPVEDLILRVGEGAELFEKDMKIVAAINGTPFLAVDGRVSVFGEEKINGDYGAVSGPVETDASLYVKGIVTGEYPIRGGRIEASEIRGADIDIVGDIKVDIGITGSVIRCEGDVRARYIRGSVIETCGSVIVDKEIIDSKVFASGIVRAAKSKIIASVIAAKRGVEAGGIGTGTSVPCEITIGSDQNIFNRVRRIEAAVERNESLIEESINRTTVLRAEQAEVNTQLIAKMDYLKKIKNAVAVIERNIVELQVDGKHKDLKKAKRDLIELEGKSQKSASSVRKLSEELKKINEELIGLPEKVKEVKGALEQLQLDKLFLLKWEKGIDGRALLIVTGDISAGTVISGRYAFEELRSKATGVKVIEKKVPDAAPEEWRLEFGPA